MTPTPTPTPPETKNLLDLLPDRKIQISLSWLISGVILLVSLSTAYAGYKAGFENQAVEIAEVRAQVKTLSEGLVDLKTKIVALTTSLDDLKSSIDTDHDRRR